MTYRKKGIVDGREYEPMKEPRYAEFATFMRAPLATPIAPARVMARARSATRRA